MAATMLDELHRARALIERLHRMDDAALHAALAEGFREEQAPNDTPLTGQQWGYALLGYLREGSTLLAARLSPDEGEWQVRQTVTEHPPVDVD